MTTQKRPCALLAQCTLNKHDTRVRGHGNPKLCRSQRHYTSLFLTMDEVSSSEISVRIYKSTRRNIPGDLNLHQHCFENLSSAQKFGQYNTT